MMLEVLISTCGPEGLERTAAMHLPRIEGVRYLVSAQLPVPVQIPAALDRTDVKVVFTPTRGLSVNRNHALAHATGDVLLIADDDLEFDPDGLRQIIKVFEADAFLDFAAFRHTGGDGKWFPSQGFSFADKEPKGYYLTSFELALRRTSLPSDIRFPENMGVGTPCFGAGEENVFMLLMRRRGMNGRFFPITVACHPAFTTGAREATAAVLRGQGAWLRLRYGVAEGFLRLLRDVPRRNAPALKSLRFMADGFIRAKKVFESPQR